MATTPSFIATPRISTAVLPVVNTFRDGSMTTSGAFNSMSSGLLTGAANGTRILEVVAKAEGSSAASRIVLHLFDNTGTYAGVFDELAFTAISVAVGTSSARATATYQNLVLPSNWSLRASVTALSVGAVGGATTAASGNGTTATITTTSSHGLVQGQYVLVANVTPTGYNGTYVVTSVPSATQYSYTNTTTGSQTVAGTTSLVTPVRVEVFGGDL
jgi:hypothetical protein